MKLGHALMEGKPWMQKYPGHKEEELRVSETRCGWRLRERWERLTSSEWEKLFFGVLPIQATLSH